MNSGEVSRRELLVQGSAALAGLAFLSSPLFSETLPSQTDEEVIPWLDQPPKNPKPEVVANLRSWEELDSWLTPNDKFFSVGHYNKPVIDEKAWKLEISGLVKHPMNLTLRELKSRPRKEIIFTLECSGNSGRAWMVSAVGNAKWTGTPLAPILNEAGVLDKGIEVVFIGSDDGEEEVRGIKMKQNFARSMSLADAITPTTCCAMR